MSGGEADVKHSIWMRAVLYGGVFLAVGILAFATMSVGVANVKHADWDEKKLDYERVTEQYSEATADYNLANQTYYEAASDDNTTTEQLALLSADKEEKKQIKNQRRLMKKYQNWIQKKMFTLLGHFSWTCEE